MTDEVKAAMLKAAAEGCCMGTCDYHYGYSDGLDAMQDAIQVEMDRLRAEVDRLGDIVDEHFGLGKFAPESDR